LAAKVRILTYHRVGVPRGGAGHEALTVRPERFRRQVRALRWLGGTFTDLDAAGAWLRGGSHPGRRATVLTFDDGYDDLYAYAFPVLREAGIPAVVYLVSDRARDDWRRDASPEPLALLDWPRIREMAAAGIRFGSHTRTHARLPECTDTQLADEVGNSRKVLEDKLGSPVEHFCYPYGACDDRVVDAVRQAGYRTATTTERGAALSGADPLRLPRLTVGKRMNLARFLLRMTLRS
jgi:peptidoglycan/xylan/chitin deacetylase (PgdA/CDA1 family)